MDFAFNRVALNKLTSVVYGSNRLAQKNTIALGFTQESYMRQHIAVVDGQGFIDVYGNGLTKSDFRANKRLAKLSKRLLMKDITVEQSK